MNNLGIVISFIIGGFLIIAILTLNGRVIQNSGETVLDMTAKNTVNNITEIIRRDFQRIGYNMNNSEDPVQTAKSHRVTFWADIDSIHSSKADKITWEFKKNSDRAVSTTGNPNDYELIRTSSGSSDIYRFPVTKFELSYSDSTGSNTTVASDVRSIKISIEAQSPETYGENQYSKSLWEKTFSPPNLKLQDFEW